MASNKTITYRSVDEVLRDVLDSDFEVDSGSEYGELSSEEEEMIDAGCDPQIEPADESVPRRGLHLNDAEPGPSTSREHDGSPAPLGRRSRKRAREVPVCEEESDSESSSEGDEGNWKNSTEPDTEPYRMNFTPHCDPGFQLPADQNWTPFSLFSLFFSQRSINLIVENTNKFGNKLKTDSSYFRWFQLTSKEFLAFLGIIIFMGLVDVPSLAEYWNDDGFFRQDFVRSSGMTRTRFMNILRVLHLCDYEQDNINEVHKSRKEPYDPLFKLKPLMDELQLACKAYFVPKQNISIDERMVAFKGRIGMKQYIKDKPTKWGFKLWILASSDSGYTYKFQVYTGKRLTPTTHGLGYDVVMGLMDGLFTQGYHLFCDNFYSSPKLCSDLFEKGCFLTGTIRKNRVGFLRNLGNPLPAKAGRGTSRWFREGQTVFVKWKDTKVVCALSTFYPATGRDFIERGKGKLVGGRYVKDRVNIPPPMKGYNANMGGVDLSDQLLKCYEIVRKSRKWWKTLFFHFIDVGIVNSFIIHRSIGGKLTHKLFRVNLAKALLERSEMAQDPSPGPGRPRKYNCRVDHCPVAISPEGLDNKSTKASLGRKNCKLCYEFDKKQMKTPWQCAVCNIPLCLQLDRNCFQRWHTAECDHLRD